MGDVLRKPQPKNKKKTIAVTAAVAAALAVGGAGGYLAMTQTPLGETVAEILTPAPSYEYETTAYAAENASDALASDPTMPDGTRLASWEVVADGDAEDLYVRGTAEDGSEYSKLIAVGEGRVENLRGAVGSNDVLASRILASLAFSETVAAEAESGAELPSEPIVYTFGGTSTADESIFTGSDGRSVYIEVADSGTAATATVSMTSATGGASAATATVSTLGATPASSSAYTAPAASLGTSEEAAEAEEGKAATAAKAEKPAPKKATEKKETKKPAAKKAAGKKDSKKKDKK